jgi:hypothetical protein
MLTIKLIESKGHEQVHPVKRVTADPNPANGPNAFTVHAWPLDSEEPLMFQSNGTVYVMNDAGQTVSKYWLGSEPSA